MIAEEFGFSAHAHTLSSACPAGLDAVWNAAAMVRAGKTDVALAGGADAPVCALGIACLQQSGLVSRKDVAPEKEEEAEPQRQIAVRPKTDAGDARVPPQDEGLHDDECNRQYSGDEEKRRYVKRLDQIDENTPFASRDSSGISSGRLVDGRGLY